ncbi:MAG: PEGA domain-containing protein [Polyangiaceae bacterium]|nr:PEGA domain-containing protein [Polyangiaceae bacterium]
MNTRNAVSALAATALLALATAAPAQAPSAQPTASASAEPDENTQRFVRGVKLFREGDFRSALVEFRRFYEATKNFKVLYNIGQAEFEVQDYAGALASFKRYLELGGAEIDAARKAEVEAEIKGLADRVASVHIESNVAGADVLIDDVIVGKTPLNAVTVSMGRRKVVLQKDGVSSPPRFFRSRRTRQHHR